VSIDLPPPLTMTADPQLRTARPRPRPDLAKPRPDALRPDRSRLDRLLTRGLTSRAIWLAPVLIVQAWFSFRLSNTLEDDEALYINAGHQLITHMLHGTPAPAFGTYFSGVPSLYAVPAAMIDHVGGVALVHATNTVIVLLATVFVYLSTRRMISHPAALIAAAAFAVNPAAIFVGRFASFDAPSLLLLAIATYLAVRSSDHWRYAVATGPCLVLAVAAKYFAVAFVPSVLALLLIVSAQRVGIRRALKLTALAVLGLLVAGGIGLLVVAPTDWQGVWFSSLHRSAILPESRTELLRACVRAIGGLAVAGLVGAVLLRRRWLLASLLLATSLIPSAVQIRLGDWTSLQKNMVFGLIFLAPLVGVAGVALLRQGRRLGLRAPIALVCFVLLLSSGMGTSTAMIDGWPNSTTIDTVLSRYVHPGSDSYLVDNSQIPEYYLSGISNYDQWHTTYDSQYHGAHGVQVMQDQLADGQFRLFLYRDEGSTIGLDRKMLSVLHRRYTLVAKIPLSPDDPHQFWYLWLAELPR
jgi:hypothetical protein